MAHSSFLQAQGMLLLYSEGMLLLFSETVSSFAETSMRGVPPSNVPLALRRCPPHRREHACSALGDKEESSKSKCFRDCGFCCCLNSFISSRFQSIIRFCFQGMNRFCFQSINDFSWQRQQAAAFKLHCSRFHRAVFLLPMSNTHRRRQKIVRCSFRTCSTLPCLQRTTWKSIGQRQIKSPA